MKTYHMELTQDDAKLIVDVVNQLIDSRLQAVTDSSFEVVDRGIMGKRLACDIAPNDMRVIIRRLLEMDDESAESLVGGIAQTLGIEEIWLTIDDRFYIVKTDTRHSEWPDVQDNDYWPNLFNEVL